MTTEVLLLLQLLSTLPMVGLIWFVQLAHYPLYRHVGRETFPAYHDTHLRRTTVVAPFMLVELGASATWCVTSFGTPDQTFSIVGLILVAKIWFSTMLLQVPCHRELERNGPDPATIDRLVGTNWIRTIAWTARAALLVWVIASRGGLAGSAAA